MLDTRRVFSTSFVWAAFFCFVMAGLYVPGRLAVGDTVKHSRMIEAAFNEAANYVDSFRLTNDRLPSKAEFSAWAQAQPNGAFSVDGVSILLTPPVDHHLGPMPPGSYMLGFWRGEWYELFAGWSRETTLDLDPNGFYLSGSFWSDLAAWVLLGIALLLVSRRVSPNRSFKPNPPRYAVGPDESALHSASDTTRGGSA